MVGGPLYLQRPESSHLIQRPLLYLGLGPSSCMHRICVGRCLPWKGCSQSCGGPDFLESCVGIRLTMTTCKRSSSGDASWGCIRISRHLLSFPSTPTILPPRTSKNQARNLKSQCPKLVSLADVRVEAGLTTFCCSFLPCTSLSSPRSFTPLHVPITVRLTIVCRLFPLSNIPCCPTCL